MDVLIGNQTGDEGKGKIVDMLSKKYDTIARFQGGSNAGHTIYLDDNKIVLHLIPSGIIHNHTKNILGNGMVIDPIQLMNEVLDVKKHIPNAKERIYISEKAHLVTPIHIIEDRIENSHIGTTLKGIGNAYKDKVYRKGIRVQDIDEIDYKYLKKRIETLSKDFGFGNEYDNILKEFKEGVEYIKKMNIVNSAFIRSQKNILAEGAQGTFLDIDHGSYPYVTSSNTVSGYASVGLGVPPQSINRVYGVFKSYLTRVGNGEMVTELNNDIGQKIGEIGNEFGATTGRKRRCGWLNLDELIEAVHLNGVTDLVITKVDILKDFKEVCIYHNGKYVKFKGWERNDLSDDNLREYIEYIEEHCGQKIKIISYGPNRNEYIER